MHFNSFLGSRFSQNLIANCSCILVFFKSVSLNIITLEISKSYQIGVKTFFSG